MTLTAALLYYDHDSVLYFVFLRIVARLPTDMYRLVSSQHITNAILNYIFS